MKLFEMLFRDCLLLLSPGAFIRNNGSAKSSPAVPSLPTTRISASGRWRIKLTDATTRTGLEPSSP